jgi:hypothetical protein
MVIAKPKWFKKRKSGFNSFEMSWKGWIYSISIVSVLFVGLTLPQTMINNLITGGLFTFLFTDMIATHYKSLDERGKMHYSISMMNMAWGMLITIIIGSIVLNYNDIQNGLSILIMVTALVGSSIGFLTRYKLQKEN